MRLSNTGGPSVTAALSLFLLPACRRLYQLTGLIHSYQPPGWGRGRTWTAQPCGGVQGPPPPPAAAPDGEPPQLPLFASGFQHGLGIFLLPFAGACPPRLLTLRCDCILSTPARLLPVAAEWGGVGGEELLLRRKPKSPKLGVSVTGSDLVGRRELKYFGFTCNTRTPCSPGVVANEINILRRFSSTI